LRTDLPHTARGQFCARPRRTNPAAPHYVRAEPFRKLAAELGEPSRHWRARYALTVAGVATAVLGVKDRAELAWGAPPPRLGALTVEQLRTVNALR
jgi:hypothetical protein